MTGKELIKRYKSCLKGFEDVGSTDILEEMIDNALIEARTEPVAKLHCSDGLSDVADWLDEARELISDWGAYVPEYFQSKHDLAGDIEKYKKRADKVREAIDR